MRMTAAPGDYRVTLLNLGRLQSLARCLTLVAGVCIGLAAQLKAHPPNYSSNDGLSAQASIDENTISKWESDGTKVIRNATKGHQGPRYPVVISVRLPNGELTPAQIAIAHLGAIKWEKLDQPFLPHERQPLRRSERPDWFARFPTHIDGQLTGNLPAGTYELFVGKGLEFLSRRVRFEVKPSETTQQFDVEIDLAIDMPAQGWWSGDPHVHIERSSPERNEEIILAAQAEDIHFLSLLMMGDAINLFFPQYAFGKGGYFSKGDYWIASGQEDPRTPRNGHLILLNTDKFYRDRRNYMDYASVVRNAKQNSSVAGIAHFYRNTFGSRDAGFALAEEELLDFVEIIDGEMTFDPSQYFDLLQSGHKVAVTAGSDYPFSGHIGDNRTYAFIQEDVSVSPSAWYHAVRDGRTFATNGPLIKLSVNGKTIGDTVNVKRGKRLKVSADAYSFGFSSRLRNITIIANGEELLSKDASADEAQHLELRKKIKATEEMWLIAIVRDSRGGVAITSPIYITLN